MTNESDWKREHEQRPVRDNSRLMPDALPCPFCGSSWIELARLGHYLHCLRCGADGPDVEFSRDPEKWRKALRLWNGRGK